MREDNRRRISVASTVVVIVCGLAAAPARDVGGGRLPELTPVAAGTGVGDGPPPGWSHLVLKSVGRIESGDLDTLPDFASSMATLFRTVILADVRPSSGEGPAGFTLARVGLGLCVPVGGIDTVVTSEARGSVPASLGLVDRQVLARAEGELRKARLVARTRTCAVLVAPSVLKVGPTHRRVLLVYLLLVDRRTGGLRTLVYATADDPGLRTALPTLTLLPDRLRFRYGLDVAARRWLSLVPVNWSFALRELPPGRDLPAPKRLQPWLLDPETMTADPSGFEREVRAAFPDPAAHPAEGNGEKLVPTS